MAKLIKCNYNFMNELHNIQCDEICIQHELFVKYNILSLAAGSSHISRLIEQYKLKENLQVVEIKINIISIQKHFYLF